jgi:DNA invertase Pin-like site-specific DNA recombinase
MVGPLVAGYVLVSTDPGIPSPDAQTKAIKKYCEHAGLELTDIWRDAAGSGGMPIYRRAAGERLEGDLRRGDHIVTRFDCLASTPLEATFILRTWYLQNITTHLVDVHIDGVWLSANNPQVGGIIEALVEFGRAGQRMTGSRARETIADLKKQGKRYCGTAPFGFTWQKRHGGTFLIPDEYEQTIQRQVAALWVQGHTIDAIRQYLAYTWKVKNRNNKEFGCSEIRKMAIRGAQEKARELEVSPP